MGHRRAARAADPPAQKDLDAIVALEELPVLARFLLGRGFTLKLVWEENRWAPCPEPPDMVGRERPAAQAATAFVLEDGSGREIDFHVVRLDEHGRLTPAWNTDLVFPPGVLAGVGTVGGTRVRCLSAQMQMRTHTGYALEESEVHDLRLLHDRFGVDYPEEVADLFSDG